MRTPESPPAGFSHQVRRCFGRQAAHYDQGALLQAAVAWRLAHLCRNLALPNGPCADLGAGSGLLARAIAQQRPGLELLRLDNCPELLAQGISRAPGPSLQWDLERGLPSQLDQAALLASNFALQWLQQPERELQRWCQQLQPGGWLAVAVPTAGSFAPWRAAASGAGVPFTGLGLPDAASLEAVARQELTLHRCRLLHFSRPSQDGLTFLRQMKAIGAQASRKAPLRPTQLRQLLAHWPTVSRPQPDWQVLLMLGRKR
ncbi:methyltransferase domain-containing protein [Synechococcus sp. HJ21-Hayes]|uniref:methyltransferase domain-containing protein n=1 Tax=unclassified Synechococcus TaxID=2626047 RepID=UPI0020CD54F9|nr:MULTISPECIES: methyltransferase domain-containing protein [unclassified Synechococcus]MCP9829800.1 methyltransferase domain-containing protein [Synechococcus sp. JJ3a-Johnson]MCP9851461.1 methyltransferase domain-containing protein [Synechococcus sp. HJ21-Hayes]